MREASSRRKVSRLTDSFRDVIFAMPADVAALVPSNLCDPPYTIARNSLTAGRGPPVTGCVRDTSVAAATPPLLRGNDPAHLGGARRRRSGTETGTPRRGRPRSMGRVAAAPTRWRDHRRRL